MTKYQQLKERFHNRLSVFSYLIIDQNRVSWKTFSLFLLLDLVLLTLLSFESILQFASDGNIGEV